MTEAVLILASDRVAAGEREDRTADGVRGALASAGITLVSVEVVPDERSELSRALVAAAARAPLVLTSGGTGLGPRDVTPEATRDVIEREIPGLAEVMRARSRDAVPTADLSRALAGSRGRTLIVNLPGSPKGAVECLVAVLPATGHALRVLADAVADCAEDLGPPAAS